MTKKDDAFGEQIQAFFKGQYSFEVIERNDGFLSPTGATPTYFADFEKWPAQDKEAMRHVKGKVLDIGAGAGRCSLYLQQQGFDVLAIDNSTLAADVCRKRTVKNVIVLPVGKITSLKPQRFDTVLLLGNNFGLLESFTKARKSFKDLHSITTDDACILAQSTNVFINPGHINEKYYRENEKNGRLPGQLRIRLRYNEFVGSWVDWLLVTELEMREIIFGTGWKIDSVIGSTNSMYTAVIRKQR